MHEEDLESNETGVRPGFRDTNSVPENRQTHEEGLEPIKDGSSLMILRDAPNPGGLANA